MRKLLFTLFLTGTLSALQAQVRPFMTEEPFTLTKQARQGAACYKNLLFQFHNANPLVEIFDLKEQKRIYQIELEPEPVIHCNNANFGSVKYDKKDPFPLLYVSSERDQRIITYRVTHEAGKYGLQKVQTIFLPNSDEASYYYTNLIIDSKQNKLWITGYTRHSWNKPDGGNQLRYVQFDLPKVSDGDVVLDYKNCISEFRLPFRIATQGAVFHKGKICQAFGCNQKDTNFIIVNPKTGHIEKEYSIGGAGIKEEPEGTFVFKNKLMVVTCVPGNIYYVSDFVEK